MFLPGKPRHFGVIVTLVLVFIYIAWYHVDQSTFINRIMYNNALIERILEEIPTCTTKDRYRQGVLLTTLQAWSKLAEKHNIQYWIIYGTLIGYVQRRGLIPHDLNIDIIMMTADIPQLIEISQSNFSSIYELRIQPQWNIINYQNRSYFHEQGIHFVAPDARFIHIETSYHIDIFPSYDFNPLYSTKSIKAQQSDTLTVYDNDYNWLSYPRSWTYPLRTCYFSGIKTLCPAEPEKIVAMIYGPEALTTSDTKCVNGSWVRNILEKNKQKN